MSIDTNEKLRILVENARAELQGAVENYGALVGKLEVLEQSLGSGNISDDILASTRNAFPAKLTPSRAAAPASDGLTETRKLLVELNHLVDLRRPKRS
jgi:hypothetical protein